MSLFVGHFVVADDHAVHASAPAFARTIPRPVVFTPPFANVLAVASVLFWYSYYNLAFARVRIVDDVPAVIGVLKGAQV